MPDRGVGRTTAVMAMDALLVWCIRLLLATLSIGAASLLAGLILLVRDAEGDLRRVLGGVAMWSFGCLGLLVSVLLAFALIRGISRMWRNELSRRRHLVSGRVIPGRPGENQDGGL